MYEIEVMTESTFLKNLCYLTMSVVELLHTHIVVSYTDSEASCASKF